MTRPMFKQEAIAEARRRFGDDFACDNLSAAVGLWLDGVKDGGPAAYCLVAPSWEELFERIDREGIEWGSNRRAPQRCKSPLSWLLG